MLMLEFDCIYATSQSSPIEEIETRRQKYSKGNSNLQEHLLPLDWTPLLNSYVPFLSSSFLTFSSSRHTTIVSSQSCLSLPRCVSLSLLPLPFSSLLLYRPRHRVAFSPSPPFPCGVFLFLQATTNWPNSLFIIWNLQLIFAGALAATILFAFIEMIISAVLVSSYVSFRFLYLALFPISLPYPPSRIGRKRGFVMYDELGIQESGTNNLLYFPMNTEQQQLSFNINQECNKVNPPFLSVLVYSSLPRWRSSIFLQIHTLRFNLEYLSRWCFHLLYLGIRNFNHCFSCFSTRFHFLTLDLLGCFVSFFLAFLLSFVFLFLGREDFLPNWAKSGVGGRFAQSSKLMMEDAFLWALPLDMCLSHCCSTYHSAFSTQCVMWSALLPAIMSNSDGQRGQMTSMLREGSPMHMPCLF